ncbi:hypothetical protein [Streptomyces beijiangensis]|uniref:Lipoprotein n=1 Tax=Streptomyces beijiangensis TaxID=163361 RepID=A0A939JJN7_9ACTN|nr:hypothetical protein [Streptomyces beijiangensis]MBO0516768.1 hypothetical protein [Streptomyces beijiangensis]
MHQTKITATILVGMAVSAVSGCMAVAPPPAPVPSPRPTPSQSAAYTEPLLVQAPAIEALEAIAPPKTADPAPSAPAAPRVRHVERPAEPRSRPAAQHRKPPVPHTEPVVPLTPSDVCALGQSYGGWQPDSPQARICRQTYGR